MNLTFEIIGLTLSTIGEVLLGTMVLMVHHKLKTHKNVDDKVAKEITHEELIGRIAILLIVIGYFLQLNFFEHFAIYGM